MAFKLLYILFILRDTKHHNTQHNKTVRDDQQAPSLAASFLIEVPERTNHHDDATHRPDQ